MPRADWKLVSKTVFSIPSNISEQAAIGTYFTALDSLITLHQRQPFLHSTPEISLTVQLIHPFYTSSWEQRKLSEIADKVTEKNAGLQYVETFTNSAEFGIISQRDFFDHDIAKLGSLDGYYIVKNEDFVYNPRISTSAPVGPINRNKLGRTGVMSPLYTVFRPHDVDTTYLEHFFKCAYWHSFMNFNGDSGARSDRFSIKDDVFFQMPIPLPYIDEQRKIGELLTRLDHLITLHQRKCVFLFGFFQAFISMIFTASTFSWEQRKLGELVDRVVRKNTNNESTLPLTISAQYGLVDQITYFNNRVASRDVSNYYLVLNGEFAYNKSTSDGYPFGAVKRLDLYEKGVLSTLYIVFAPKKEQQIDSDYLTVFFDTDRWHKGVAERAAEGARNHGLLNISAEDFFDIDLSVPKDIVEQKQIGAFIRQLDNLITLHQRECISFTARAGRRILTANKKRNTSSWEQRKLGDIADIVGGGTPSTGNQSYWDGDIDWYAPAEIADQIYANSSQKKITGLGYENSSAKMLPPGTVLFTSRAGIGKTAILTRKGCTNQGFQSIVPHRGELDSYFIFSRTEELKRYGELVGAGSTFVEVSGKQMAVMELMMPPTMREQQTIGGFFQQLDHLITLHQRKPFLMKWRTSDANRNKTNRLVL